VSAFVSTRYIWCPLKIQLRPYQHHAVQEIRRHYGNGKSKVLLHLSTGGGKTVIFSYIMGKLKEGKTAIMVVRGRSLVEQASARLDQFGLSHGVIMAGNGRVKPNERIQVCSIDTLHSRLKNNLDLPSADLVVIDEAHLANNQSFIEVLNQYSESRILAVTATPHVKKGLKHIAETIVRPCTFNDLVESKSLVPPKYYCPSKLDRSGIKVQSTGDFSNKDAEKAVEDQKILGNVMGSYKDLIGDHPAIIFAASVKHSKRICDEFNAAGITARHVDAKTKNRLEIIKEIETGKAKILVNVGVFCTGLDIPCLRGVIMVRPTKSYNLFIQQVGRGTRPFPGKENFIVIDHVGNVLDHGLVEDEPEADLEPQKKQKRNAATQRIVTCESCYAAYPWDGNGRICPDCGFENPVNIRQIEEEDDTMIELTPHQRELLKAKSDKKRFTKTQRLNGYKAGWVYHKLREKYGESIAQQVCKRRVIPPWAQQNYMRN
jgi:DNA repair protein RadD